MSSAAIVAALLAITAGGRFAAASPDDCSISGMQGSYACPLSTWETKPAQQQQAGSGRTCTPHYELYSSHVEWVNDCPAISQAPAAPQPAR
jgi:hypothetical protein